MPKKRGGWNPLSNYDIDFLFGLILIVATPELPLNLYAERFSLNLLSSFPISVLILFIFFNWFSARASAKLPIMFTCFAVNLSRMLEKHVVSRFPSISCIDGLGKILMVDEGLMGYKSLKGFSGFSADFL